MAQLAELLLSQMAAPVPLSRALRPGGYVKAPGDNAEVIPAPAAASRYSALLPPASQMPAGPGIGAATAPRADPANPYAGQPGLLGLLLGNDNPVAKWTGDNRNFLRGIGSALLSSGMDFSRVPMAAALDDERRANATAWDQSVSAKRQMIETLRQYGDGYGDIAQALETDAIDPKAAWNEMFRRRGSYAEQERELGQARANAQFLTDPQLRQMVEAGALPFEDALKMERGGGVNSVNYGTSLQYGRDAAGNLVPLQAGDNGTLIRSALPEGVVSIDPGAAAGARAASTYDAKTVAAANAALPGVEQNLAIALDAIDRLRNDKAGLEANFSQWGMLPRGMYVQGGTPLANWMTNLNQASGQAFMQARQALKGGGQITDYEGRRAEAAISRISDAAKSGDLQTFLAALDEFEAAVTDGYAKLREVAGGTYQPGGGGAGDVFERYGLER